MSAPSGSLGSGALDGDAGFAARSFLRSAGMTADQIRRRPVIGICTSWSELNPCNLPLRAVARAVKAGVEAAGGVAMEFPTISLSEALVRPTTMMLRNLMAMDVEEMINASPIDGVVLLNGCDKTVAAQLMGAVSADKPALSLGSGHRPLGSWQGQSLTIEDSWRLADERRVGQLTDADWLELEGCLSPGPGVCNVLGTAVTLAMLAEVLGFSVPGSSLLRSGSEEHLAVAEATGRHAVAAVMADRRPSSALTRSALLDAWRVACATGGSTNSIIHLLAIAGRAGVDISMAELQEVSRTTPTLGRVKPNGPYGLAQLQAEGGVGAVLRELSDDVDLERLTADGNTWQHVVDQLAGPVNKALASRTAPVAVQGSIAVLRGTLAPRGAVIKRSAATPALLRHVGPAIVFDGVDDLYRRLDAPDLHITADSVLVLRNVGPHGGPGMPEAGAIPIPAALYQQGVRDMVRISDARMSGTAAGTVVLHVSPESAARGPLGLVRDGDLIELDVDAGRLDLLVAVQELSSRALGHPDPRTSSLPVRGYARLYQQHVLQADRGCDFDFLSALPAASGTIPLAHQLETT